MRAMSRRDGMTMTIDLAMRQWGPRVAEAALAFEARFTKRSVRVFNSRFADAFDEALSDWHRAVTVGTSTNINESGSRLCRAYAVISAELATARIPEDAAMIGMCPTTKQQVIIAATPAAAEHARAGCYRFAKWISPDEVATLIGLDERAKKIGDVKAFFPRAEIMGVTIDADDC